MILQWRYLQLLVSCGLYPMHEHDGSGEAHNFGTAFLLEVLQTSVEAV